jgi:hypothetical protein
VVNLIPQVGQLFQGDSEIGMILQTIFSLSFIIYLFYAQRIQAMSMLRQVEGTLRKIKKLKDEGRQISINMVKEIGKPAKDPTLEIDRFLEQFIVPPVDLDPAGIVGKLDQLINVRRNTFEAELSTVTPEATEAELNNLENLIGSAHALNYYYKAVRHFYLLGKKTMNIYIIMQIHMILPMLMREIEAISASLQAFQEGIPIGDGVGPLVAAKIMNGHEWKEVEKETIIANVPYEGRDLIVMKAKGPGGSVGKPGEAMAKILNNKRRKKKVKSVVMIDAAGKFEGESPGAIAEGVGAIIGGIGVEKYKIEEAAKANEIPLYAVAIKLDIAQAISPMIEDLSEATDKAVDSVKRIINERTEEGDVVLVVGVGNTIGIGQ